ncbi:katanin p80 WD40 repeat-containing subunit B1-like [Anopheles albimanus]|uniref:Katanin p80 WD40 repeat-containing subunit B1 n=1 Tax=Anopheles albimanus TaxID=7167 RepID=A0A182FJ61_ANOAL|nr:katanin p80 WD40 repeat-containing subunit B1-like [Anopheles albimanus]
MLPSMIYDIQAQSSKVTCLNLGETGRVLVTGGQDRNIKLWAFSSKQCSMTLPGHKSSIECVKFAYSDDFVFSADDTGVIKLWNLNVGESTSLYGHMKSVRTLDVYPMNDNYAVSGSNDTTIRLWDIRAKECVKRYRGHMSHVNSVKFSPDGLWIASAGHEGSVIIWDIRMSSKFREFSERPTHATVVQYHPSDLLMAAGRHDGTVDLYDLEQFKLLTRTMPPPPATAASNGQPVRCVTFDESGKCLFVGTAAGITVIGWEPDQEFDRIELNAGGPAAPWQLGDMHIAGQELLYGTHEGGAVAIHAVPCSGLGALRVAQPNTNQTFTYNQSSRKSFNRGSGKLRLSIGVDRMGTAGGSGADGDSATSATATLAGYDDCSSSNGAGGGGGGGGGGMSPNLSIEIIDEEDVTALATGSTASELRSSQVFMFDTIGTGRDRSLMRRLSPATSTTSLDTVGLASTGGSSSTVLDYPSQKNGSLLKPDKEDFPVNSAQPPDYAPKAVGGGSSMQSASAASATVGNTGSGTSRAATGGRSRQDGTASGSAASSNSIRSSAAEQRRQAASNRSTINHTQHMNPTLPHSKSTLELYPGLEPVPYRKPISRGYSPIRSNHHQQSQSGGYYQHGGSGSSSSSKMHRSDSAQINSGRQYGTDRQPRSNGAHNGNIKVEIVTKPVVRSKTSLDMRHGHERSTSSFHGGPRQPSAVMHSSSASSMPTNGGSQLIRGLSENHPLQVNGNGFGDGIGSWPASAATDEFELKVLRHEHHTIMQTLKNRNALLVAIRRYTTEGNVIGALKAAAQMPDNQILVDLLGAMLEKTSQWTLDMCVLLLPKLYDMLQSDVKFHCTRACDTLRDILSTFLPVIRENTDPLGACTIGVDVSREERQKKCLECKRWLLKIRCLPENLVVVSSFQQLQNMLVDI